MAALAALTGCSGMDRDACIAVGTGTGAFLGGTAGTLGAYYGFRDDVEDGSLNWRMAGTGLAGLVAGGAAGWAIANAVCEEPPAPPPPPRPAPPPPPPPPPASDRRGG